MHAAIQNSFSDPFQTLSEISIALYKFYTVSTIDIERGEPNMQETTTRGGCYIQFLQAKSNNLYPNAECLKKTKTIASGNVYSTVDFFWGTTRDADETTPGNVCALPTIYIYIYIHILFPILIPHILFPILIPIYFLY